MQPSAIHPHAAAPPSPPLPLRPTYFDYLLILLGIALSLYLADLSGYQVRTTEDTPDSFPLSMKRIPALLFLPLGVLLLWPMFYASQRIVGRPEALTPGEWLWGLAWLAVLGLTTWFAWQSLADSPEAIKTREIKGQVFFGYSVGVLSLGALALLLVVGDLFSRQRKPWTHAFGLVLLIWPALVLLGLLACKLQVE